MGTNNFYKYQGSKSGNEETGFFNTKGRISRKAYLLRLLLVLGIYLVSCLLVNADVYEEENVFHQYILPGLLVVFLLIQGAKRMHDVDRTGWAFLIPVYNVYLSLLPGTPGNNSFGVDPTPPKTSEYFDDLGSFQKNSSGSLGEVAPFEQSTSSQLGSRLNLPVKQLLLFLLAGLIILGLIFREDLANWLGGSTTTENAAPTDITLSSYEVMENKSPGTKVAAFSTKDIDENDSHSYALVDGPGDTDNGSFAISGDSLTTTKKFDFESKDSYSIQVQVTDGKGGVFARTLTIAINDDVSDNRKIEEPEKGGVGPTPPSEKPGGIWYCIGKGEPIKLSQVGNGVCDCPDGSDERPGLCK